MTMGERVASKMIRLFAVLRPDEYHVEVNTMVAPRMINALVLFMRTTQEDG